jgi:hypothetical protein
VNHPTRTRLPPFAAQAFRRARADWLAMSKCGRVGAERGGVALAASSFLNIFKAHWIAEPQDVHADIARDQQSLARQRNAMCPA